MSCAGQESGAEASGKGSGQDFYLFGEPLGPASEGPGGSRLDYGACLSSSSGS